MYPLIRPLLFQLEPEHAHRASFALADIVARIQPRPHAPRQHMIRCMELDFPNRIGLAAGLDKNGEHLRALAQMGFGHIEIGTVTPRAQPGNPAPRLFRLPEHRAVINRMGFNNQGVDALVANVQRARERDDFDALLGINLGKNKDTPNEQALDDYRIGIQKTGAHADYLTINISSPNTASLRELQGPEALAALLAGIADERARLADRIGRRVPVALKIAPDLTPDDLDRIADQVREAGLDAIIATNTTVARDAIAGHRLAAETGGLSGAPVRDVATAALSRLRARVGARLPLIGVGGVVDADAAREKFTAGATLVQLYSGLIYRGPQLVRECLALDPHG